MHGCCWSWLYKFNQAHTTLTGMLKTCHTHKDSLEHRYIHCCWQILDVRTVPHSHHTEDYDGMQNRTEIKSNHHSAYLSYLTKDWWKILNSECVFQNTTYNNQHFPSMRDKRLIVVLYSAERYSYFHCANLFKWTCMNDALHHLSYLNVIENMQQ